MSQRTRKVESLVQQLVAAEIRESVGNAAITVTGVSVSPDLRQATIWVSVLSGNTDEKEKAFKQVEGARSNLQSALARGMTTKFVPRIHLKQDNGGEYASHIANLIHGLE